MENKDNNKQNRKDNYYYLRKLNYPKVLQKYKNYMDNTISHSVYDMDKKDKNIYVFPTQQEIAERWERKFSNQVKDALFVQTKLHYLPEKSWSKLTNDVDDNKNLNGYRTYDRQVFYYVNLSDTDELSRNLFNLFQKRTVNRDELLRYLLEFEENSMEDSWLYIRGQKILELTDNNLIVLPSVYSMDVFTTHTTQE